MLPLVNVAILGGGADGALGADGGSVGSSAVGAAAIPPLGCSGAAATGSGSGAAGSGSGADAAAGLISATIATDAVVIRGIAEAVEADAYTIQERNDPRRRPEGKAACAQNPGASATVIWLRAKSAAF